MHHTQRKIVCVQPSVCFDSTNIMTGRTTLRDTRWAKIRFRMFHQKPYFVSVQLCLVHFLFLSRTHTLSFSFSFSLSLSLSVYLSLSLSLSLSLTHTHTHTNPPTHARAHTHTKWSRMSSYFVHTPQQLFTITIGSTAPRGSQPSSEAFSIRPCFWPASSSPFSIFFRSLDPRLPHY